MYIECTKSSGFLVIYFGDVGSSIVVHHVVYLIIKLQGVPGLNFLLLSMSYVVRPITVIYLLLVYATGELNVNAA